MRVIGELLIFFLLFLTNVRVFFVRHEKRDALVILAPVSVVLVILHICAWGLDLINLYCFVLSILVLLTNFHALFRYSESLYVDHYSVLMLFWAICTSILAVAGFVVCILGFPVTYDNGKLGITENKQLYEGSIRSGFKEKKLSGKTNAILTEFSPVILLEDEPEAENAPEAEPAPETAEIALESPTPETAEIVTESPAEAVPVILFVPDKRGDTDAYRNYLQLLASKGYTVCSGDFYVDDIHYLENHGGNKMFRRFAIRWESILDSEAFDLDYTQFNYNISQELPAFITLAQSVYGADKKFFLITDGMGCDSVENYSLLNPDLVAGCFELNSIADYKTAGYGIVGQTAPLVAKILGEGRDSKGLVTEKLVEESVAAIARLNMGEENDTERTE